MIFRWALWESNDERREMLFYSIISFRQQFGVEHEYIVFTDHVIAVEARIGGVAEVRLFPVQGEGLFNVHSKATWLKWCPSSRIDIRQTEVYVDSDVFLMNHPIEINTFLNDDSMKFAVLDEFAGAPWQHGAMQSKAPKGTPFINAGLFIQKAQCDITAALLEEYAWWQQNVPIADQTHHDEQGALAIALGPYLDELLILPKDKYMLISDDQNAHLNSLDGITLFHSTYPDHPAFYRFRSFLDQILFNS